MARGKNTEVQIFSERLRAAMQMRGLSQGDLAKGSNITQASISRYLNGVTEPKSRELFQIARFLGVTMESLLTDEPMEQAPSSVIIWQEKARAAEQKLEALKSGLVELVKKY